FMAMFLPREKKLSFLECAATKLDLAKFFLQITWELRALDNKKYAMISEELVEVGKMLGGWLRQLASRTAKHP
ncbi:MAG: four helix bundle protein, partial [Patescibacteria group bacterium]|nr:four helix bundle protein [Patescibacteria group bacterium]